MHEGDQHLVRIEVAVQRDAADVVFVPWRTEIAQFGVSGFLELQLETCLCIRLHHHGDGGFGEIALQDLKFLRFHTAKINTFSEKIVFLRSQIKTR